MEWLAGLVVAVALLGVLQLAGVDVSPVVDAVEALVGLLPGLVQ